jgi:stage VI sporulation protein D
LKGGADLTVENQSSIRFSVEESIWFQRGQEVSELLSMSLDPEIIIQEHDQYISVRGGLILTGEYHAEGIDDSERASMSQPTGARTVQEVATREDGVSILKHKFPVDITIPKNRIQSLDDVYVTIESFDYELPQRGNLLLEAELSITGIYGDQERAQPQPVAGLDEASLDDTIEEEIEAEQEESEVETAVEEEAQPSYQEETEEEELVQPLMRGSFYEDDVEEEEQDQDPYTPFVVEAKRDATVEEEDFEENQEELEHEDAYVFTRQVPQFGFKSRIDEPAKVQEKQKEDADESYVKRDENALYLTKIFAKDDDSETTRLKICIVQKDESIESIAKRYEVQSQVLIRVNNLDREHLAEGQILYIPVPVGSLK